MPLTLMLILPLYDDADDADAGDDLYLFVISPLLMAIYFHYAADS